MCTGIKVNLFRIIYSKMYSSNSFCMSQWSHETEVHGKDIGVRYLSWLVWYKVCKFSLVWSTSLFKIISCTDILITDFHFLITISLWKNVLLGKFFQQFQYRTRHFGKRSWNKIIKRARCCYYNFICHYLEIFCRFSKIPINGLCCCDWNRYYRRIVYTLFTLLSHHFFIHIFQNCEEC